MQALAPASIAEGFAAKPAAGFPAGIAAVRVQGANYGNEALRRRGWQNENGGRFTVITTKEVETTAQVAQIAALPEVAGVVSLNRMLLPEKIEGDREIREAAARMQADLLFLYTFDTAFFDADAAKPLSVITLGLSPTRKITAVTTVSALLMDTRTGYIYSAYEVTERAATLSTSWGTRDTAEEARRGNERKAFGKLVDEFAASWPKLVQRHRKAE